MPLPIESVPAVVKEPPVKTVKSSLTINASDPALFCTKSEVVADVEPLPLMPYLADNAVFEPIVNGVLK